DGGANPWQAVFLLGKSGRSTPPGTRPPQWGIRRRMKEPVATSEKPESGSVVLSARAVALELIEAVLKRRKPLDEALNEHRDLERLVSRDKQFVRALVTCTLRHLGQIDHVLAQCLEKPLPARASGSRNIIHLGTAQTLFLKTPAHAAVDTMVTLASKRGGEAGYKGLVNAVLRRIAREADTFRQFAPGSGNFTGAISLPDWLWQS